MPAGLLLWPAAWPVWTATGGLAQGGGIGLAMALIALGAVYQATGGWTVPLLVLVAASVVMAVAGWTGGRELRPGRRWR
ncbi:MFS transporter, CP family, cyanate transporter [Jiangella alba]|uniref:MFS transporter, CP family, cyanate transporter n=1 Tax=Jiangella alba TaxID=561176 RepID=A0A1H5PVY0_9ACTN|nr:MFS transporter, CP family, cyanate transporter [Jiangella alba]